MDTEHGEHGEIARIIGDLRRAERERADLAATLETRNAEHAAAVARVAELEAIIAGRTTPPTRAELVAQLAAVTAERDEMAARHDDARADYAAVNEYLGGIVRVWQRASGEDRRMADTFVRGLRREIEEARDSGRGEWWEACRGGDPAPLRAELAVFRAQQAPLVACVDALRAAARAAGWHDADATGETLVAWVRRGGACEGAVAVRDAVMGYLNEIFPGGPAATDARWPHELMEHVACAVARAKRSAGGAT